MAVVEFRGRVMASQLHVLALHDDPAGPTGPLDEAIRETVRHLEHLERCWSRFLPDSDLSRVNRLGAAGGTVPVDPSTLTLLATMVEGFERTAGRFDPTVLRALLAEGDDTSRTDPAMVCVVAPAPSTPAASLLDLELRPAACSVTVPPGLVLDPGGIGKGLAADLAVALLLERGVHGAMVGIGGDLAMGGTPVDPAGWLIDVEHPDHDGLLCSFAVSGGGVATSSVRSRRWVRRDGVDRHHQIDARTATCSTTDLAAVTVIAPAGWLAEVHATAALAVGSDAVIDYLDGHGLSGMAVAVTSAGHRVWATEDLAAAAPSAAAASSAVAACIGQQGAA